MQTRYRHIVILSNIIYHLVQPRVVIGSDTFFLQVWVQRFDIASAAFRCAALDYQQLGAAASWTASKITSLLREFDYFCVWHKNRRSGSPTINNFPRGLIVTHLVMGPFEG